ncbi:Hypothetical protein PACV_165 [Pacmanvirus A23]|uniref:Hypothetical protein n=1 Tax=Pacmanvirus A23 TaxID=1932881 RepID=UPI000A096182|nr:Hypothetical protein B9W72_gp163 [Pacmanvirus A23]SIP85880.1 Hypothetical protein PACV_165 [Pacmanvirus A23]
MQTAHITVDLQNTIISTIKQWLNGLPTVKCIKNKYILLKRKLRIDLPETIHNGRNINEILSDTKIYDIVYWKGVLTTFKPIISIHYYAVYLSEFGNLEKEYIELINKLTEHEVHQKTHTMYAKIARLENMIFAYSE